MADVEEVGAALASTIAGMIYPDGTSAQPANGYPTKVLQGWPGANLLNAWLPPGKDAGASGGVVVSVYERPNMATNVTRFQSDWEVLQPATIPVSATLAAEVATFSGSATAPLNIAFWFGAQSVVVSFTGQEGYGAAGLATATARALTSAGYPAVATGSTVKANRLTGVTVQGIGVLAREVVRVKQGFQITVWAPSPPARLATAKAFMAKLFALDVLPLPDGTKGNLFFVADNTSDEGQTQINYRRDVFLSIEFAIIETAPGYGVAVPRVSIGAAESL